MWGNTGACGDFATNFSPLWWGKCRGFASVQPRGDWERSIVRSIYDRQDSPDRFKTESGEFRTGRKVEIFTRLRAANVVVKKKYLKISKNNC